MPTVYYNHMPMSVAHVNVIYTIHIRKAPSAKQVSSVPDVAFHTDVDVSLMDVCIDPCKVPAPMLRLYPICVFLQTC